MKVNCRPIFEESLLETYLEHINNDTLLDECNHIRTTQEGVHRSNVGGYQSPPLFRHTIQQYPTLCNLIDTIQSIIDSYIKQYQYQPPRRVDIGNFWLNFNYRHDSNAYHTHPHSVFSGAYYIKAPENCGTINFYRPYSIADTEWGHFFCDSSHSENILNKLIERVVPGAGKLILFPSYYPHDVSRSQTDELRLSLSFNSQILYL